MQGLEIGGNSTGNNQNGQQQNLMGGMNTGPPTSPQSYQMDMDCIGEMDASEFHLGDAMMDSMPSPPPHDSGNVAAWYDTDL
jgi:hypothetical protein